MPQAKYDELYAAFMNVQRTLAMLIDQSLDGDLSFRLYDDPEFPRLAYILAQKGPYYTDLSIVKVPE